jgi:hypothetical protein
VLIAWLNAGGNVGIHNKPVQYLFVLQSWLSYDSYLFLLSIAIEVPAESIS